MQFFKNLGEQFKKFWAESNPASRIGMIATLLISLGLIIAVGYWSAQPDYQLLVEDMTAEQSKLIIEELEKKNIRYKTSTIGSTIWADRKKFVQAEAIAKQHGGQVPQSTIANNMFSGPEEKRQNQIDATQRQLELMIAKISGVNSVDVKLTIAERNFVREFQGLSKASVLLNLAPVASPPSQDLIDSIAKIVSFVDGLVPENVTIVDETTGMNYTAQDRSTKRLDREGEYKRALEIDGTEKAESLLRSLVGPGNYKVTVTADVSVMDVVQTKDTIIGEAKPRSTITQTLKNVAPVPAQGIVGTAKNLAPPAKKKAGDGTYVSQDFSKVDNEYDRQNVEETKTLVTVNQMTVAVVVEIPPPAAGGTALTKVEIEDLVKSAISFDETRDRITVQVGDIVDDPILGQMLATTPIPNGTNDFLLQIIRNSSLGLGALFAFVIGYLMLKKMKPVTIREVEPQISPARARYLSDLSKIARENPEFLSRVVAGWINETPAEEVGAAESKVSTQNSRAAA